MNVGPPPRRARSTDSRQAARTARTSLPSTRSAGIPKPVGRSAIGTRVWTLTGSEMAYWLFWQKRTSGAWKEAAKTIASLTSPWLVAPSPKQVIPTETSLAMGELIPFRLAPVLERDLHH